MKEMFNKYKGYLYVLAIPYILLIVLLTYRINYNIELPGGITEVGKIISFDEEYESSGSFNSTFIMDLNKPTFFQFIVSYFDNFAETSEISESYINLSDDDLFKMGIVMKNTSIDTSVIVAYNDLGLTADYDIEQIVYLKYNYISNQEIDFGDVLLSVNENTDVINELNNTVCNEEATLFVRKQTGEVVEYILKKVEIEDSCKFGLGLSKYYNIKKIDPSYEVLPSFIGGPSGGLLQTLFIYNQLSEFDLTHGLKIAGTGTIKIDGSVGYIGGVEQKVITAHLNDVDIFFVPHLSESSNDNYVKALKTYETLDTDMILVPISSFTEAVDYLLNYEK